MQTTIEAMFLTAVKNQLNARGYPIQYGQISLLSPVFRDDDTRYLRMTKVGHNGEVDTVVSVCIHCFNSISKIVVTRQKDDYRTNSVEDAISIIDPKSIDHIAQRAISLFKLPL